MSEESCELHEWKQTEEVRLESAGALFELIVASAEYAMVMQMPTPPARRAAQAAEHWTLAKNKAERYLRRFREADWREQTGWVKPEPGSQRRAAQTGDETQAARLERRARQAGKLEAPDKM
jgi:hypothetical protein